MRLDANYHVLYTCFKKPVYTFCTTFQSLASEVPLNWWRYLQGWLLDNRRQQRHFVVQSALRRLWVGFSVAQIKVDRLTTTVLHGGSEVLSNVPAAACNNGVYWRLRLTCPPPPWDAGWALPKMEIGRSSWWVFPPGIPSRSSQHI